MYEVSANGSSATVVNLSQGNAFQFEFMRKDGSTQIRYAFKAVDDDGVNLTKFCAKADWDAL